jgi:hypothetical protein
MTEATIGGAAMTFREFWPRYLRAHRLPGTRAMHYVATAVGFLAAAEAAMLQQPWVLAAGIALAYGIAIAAHRFVEGNAPLIAVNPVWGAIADLRMTWLATTGRLGRELARHGVIDWRSARGDDGPAAAAAGDAGRPATTAERIVAALDDFDETARHALRYYGGRFPRYALLVASTAGLAAGLADLHDLFEDAHHLTYPLLQLGAPIVAFAMAAASSCGALAAAGRHLRAVLDRFAALTAEAPPGAAAARAGFGLCAERLSASEMSLRRAALVLFLLGTIAFAGAEYDEHGLWWV